MPNGNAKCQTGARRGRTPHTANRQPPPCSARPITYDAEQAQNAARAFEIKKQMQSTPCVCVAVLSTSCCYIKNYCSLRIAPLHNVHRKHPEPRAPL
jgi:hypothetical protein